MYRYEAFLLLAIFLVPTTLFFLSVNDESELVKHIPCKDLKSLINSPKITGHQIIVTEYSVRC